MLNHYPWWKNLLIIVVALVGLLLASPNLYGDDPAVQVSPDDLSAASPELVATTKAILANNDIGYKAADLRDGRVIVRFANSINQLKASDTLRMALGDEYVVALNLASRTPDWMRSLGLQPMNLGLDLRGGVHFRLEVDVQAAVMQALERYAGDIRDLLRENNIRYSSVSATDSAVKMQFRDAKSMQAASDIISSEYIQLQVVQALSAEAPNTLLVKMSEARIAEVKNFAVEQNITTLRNRVNELGVAEPLIQRQGDSSIVVELPGVQDTARAKEILGSTATLEFRMVDTAHDARRAAQTGRIPLTTELYYTPEGVPYLLERDVIVSGNQLVDALATIDQQSGGPAVSVTLDSAGASEMGKTTAEHLGDLMAVLFIENKVNTEIVDGKEVKVRETTAEIISVASINGIFSKRFIITGLEQAEAAKLALLLRAGALATPVEIVGERTISPSMGQDNIERGTTAVVVGFFLVIGFMALYYRTFGLIADVALAMNLVLIVALMSLIQATLTMPGIAGIVLTVGMAVDANVLICERIREEMRRGITPQAAINAGYENALSSIIDGNVTTLIAALVLFIFGSGPVKGFAIVLVLGLITSMFTAIMGTRAITNFVYGGRRIKQLSI